MKFVLVIFIGSACIGCFENGHSSSSDEVARCLKLVNASVTEIEDSEKIVHSWQDVNAALTNIVDNSARVSCLSNWMERLLAADLSEISDARTYYLSVEELSQHKDVIEYLLEKESGRIASEYEVGILWFGWLLKEISRLSVYKDQDVKFNRQGPHDCGMRTAYEHLVGRFDMFVRILERNFIHDSEQGLISPAEAVHICELFETHIGRSMRTKEQLRRK